MPPKYQSQYSTLLCSKMDFLSPDVEGINQFLLIEPFNYENNLLIHSNVMANVLWLRIFPSKVLLKIEKKVGKKAETHKKIAK